MPLPVIAPPSVRALMDQGALLIDIRSDDEYLREHIREARHVSMEKLAAGQRITHEGVVVFHCRSGNRTRLNAKTLAGATSGHAYVLEGGLDAWKSAGLPVVADAGQPLALQRQVQIAAGGMIVLGTALGALVSPWFYWVPGAIGAGLVFAGVSGFCGLARVLMRMPWNRRAVAR